MSTTQIDERPSWGEGGLTEAEAEQGRRLIEEEMERWRTGKTSLYPDEPSTLATEARCLKQIYIGHQVQVCHDGRPNRCPLEVLVRLVELEALGY